MLNFLGDMPIEIFLKDYWQQKPLLIRQAFANFQSPISADELAGLALEDEIESRIIIDTYGADIGAGAGAATSANQNTNKPQAKNESTSPWQLKCGPFTEEDFSNLPPSHWTLLVQAVDHYIPEVSALLDQFRFIPNWRVDDVMISYAPNGGSVGPHFDYYDVFLLQAEGQRRWQTGQMCVADSPRLEGTPLSILDEFHAQENWLLNPGDMLYLPPQLAHWGIAEGDDCMTYSFGFRAPSHADILTEITQDISSHLSNDQRYTDAGCSQQINSGEISDAAVEKIQKIIHSALESYLSKPTTIAHWLGRTMTECKYDLASADKGNWQRQEWLSDLSAGLTLARRLSTRLAYYQNAEQQTTKSATLFADGAQFDCSIAMAQLLSSSAELNHTNLITFPESQQAIITQLLNQGSLILSDNDSCNDNDESEYE